MKVGSVKIECQPCRHRLETENVLHKKLKDINITSKITNLNSNQSNLWKGGSIHNVLYPLTCLFLFEAQS